MKHAQTCLNARKAGEISFLHCGGPMSWCKAVYVPYNSVLTTEEVL